jgi:hypothetical protein
MPADLLGASVYNQKTQAFDFRPGPIFAMPWPTRSTARHPGRNPPSSSA